MAFLDNLAPTKGSTAAKAAARTSASGRSTAGKASSSPAAAGAVRAAAGRTKEKNNQIMIYVGGAVAAVVLVVVLAVAVMPSKGGGKRKAENVRFGLPESSRRQLFQELILAVDLNGISRDCKEEWFRLADKYKMDRKYLQDLLDEGFNGKDWEQPAPAHVTNKTRGIRIEWTARRGHGGDPVLAM